MARLFIIGNGFDLHHNMKTKYSDYHNFLIEHKKIGDTIFFEMYPFKRKIEDTVDEDEILDMWWSDIEANSNFDFILWANSIDTAYSCPPFTNGNGYKQLQAKADINKARKFYKDDFRTWINSINYGECCDDIKELISKEDYFISFNYTLTLERLYNIPKDHILHIHEKN